MEFRRLESWVEAWLLAAENLLSNSNYSRIEIEIRTPQATTAHFDSLQKNWCKKCVPNAEFPVQNEMADLRPTFHPLGGVWWFIITATLCCCCWTSQQGVDGTLDGTDGFDGSHMLEKLSNTTLNISCTPSWKNWPVLRSTREIKVTKSYPHGVITKGYIIP